MSGLIIYLLFQGRNGISASIPSQDSLNVNVQGQAIVKLFIAKVISKKLPSPGLGKLRRWISTKVPGKIKIRNSKLTAAEKSHIEGFFMQIKKTENYDVDILTCESLDISVSFFPRRISTTSVLHVS